MISPPHLRKAIGDYLYVEHNLDDGFASELAAGEGGFDEQLKRSLARILVSGEMDFDDFTDVTDNFSDSDVEVVARLRKIWDTAFPDLDPLSYLQSLDGARF